MAVARTHYLFLGGKASDLADIAHELVAPTPVMPDAPDLTEDDWAMAGDDLMPPDQLEITDLGLRAQYRDGCVRIAWARGEEDAAIITKFCETADSVGIAEVLWWSRSVVRVRFDPDRATDPNDMWWERNPALELCSIWALKFRPAVAYRDLADPPGVDWSRIYFPSSLWEENDFFGMTQS